MWVFWERGYGGASLAELTGAMGVNRPQPYVTFGDKETFSRDLTPTVDPAELARCITTVIRSLGIQFADGNSREQLQAVARTAMQGWPI